ncbi:MAG: MBL fold metallo-hydrolase [Mariniphaga sp.]
MKSWIQFIILLYFLLGNLPVSFSQIYNRRDLEGKPDPQLSQKDNDFMDRQDKAFLDTVQSILAKCLPTVQPENRERTMAKMLMDAVFHDPYAAYRKPVQDFFHARIDQVIRELENTKVDHGVRIWKLYNMAFIARTKSVTIAFDLVSGITSGSEDFAMTPNQVEHLVKQCDVLLITHRHEDHVQKEIAERFIESGKPVVATEQTLKNEQVYSLIQHPERSFDKMQHLKVHQNTLVVVVLPGHQMKATDNNCYLVTTPEGITIAHIGDQINEGNFISDYDWIDRVSSKYKVDVLISNCWTNDIYRIVKGFNSQLVMLGHELELGHPVWDRVPYWGDEQYLELNYSKLKASKYPVVVTIWGESFHYPPKNSN